METFYIYALRRPRTYQVVYIGLTYQPRIRFQAQKNNFRKKYKYTPIAEIIEKHDSLEAARKREWELIQYYNKISPLSQTCDRPRAGSYPWHYKTEA